MAHVRLHRGGIAGCVVAVLVAANGCCCSCGPEKSGQPIGSLEVPSPVPSGKAMMSRHSAAKAMRHDPAITLEYLQRNCTEVPTPLPGDPNTWFILGYDPSYALDDAGNVVAFYWLNANPGSPPDTKGQQCWGTFCHWVPASAVTYWTTGHTCQHGTPGYESVAFFAR